MITNLVASELGEQLTATEILTFYFSSSVIPKTKTYQSLVELNGESGQIPTIILNEKDTGTEVSITKYPQLIKVSSAVQEQVR